MAEIKIPKTSTTIYFGDENEPSTPSVHIDLDDEKASEISTMSQLAIKEAGELPDINEKGISPEERQSRKEETARFQKRVITALIGSKGYQIILDDIADDGEPINPSEYTMKIGDYYAALLVHFYKVMPGTFTAALNSMISLGKPKPNRQVHAKKKGKRKK